MWLTRLALRNPILILMMSLMTIVLGGVSLRKLDTRLPDDGNRITELAWSADGNYLAAGALTQLAILDATTGATVGGPLDARVSGIAFHPERPELLFTNAGMNQF